MIYIAWITFLFFGMRFITSAVNILFPPVLKNRTTLTCPHVSVLIPARNEENNIQNILNDLKKQNYKNIEVIVFNDQSTDRTAEKVLLFSGSESRFRLINSGGLPVGWVGKNNACYQLAKHANGEYLLFLDADVRIKSGLIESSLAQMEQYGLKLLSIFPWQLMLTTGEKMSVPLMNTILLSLLPLILTRVSSHPSLAAANGQFMLFEKKAYMQMQPHKAVRSKPVEDILIARLYKMNGLKIECMTGNETIQCRMYKGLNDAVNGFAKNIAEFFGGSHIVAAIYWILGTLGILSVIFFLSPVYTFITIGFIIGIIFFVSLISHQSVLQNLVFSIPQQIIMAFILFISIKNKFLKNTQWKERNIG